MKATVAIEPGLSPIAEALVQGGYRVVRLDQADNERADVIVVRGTDSNVTGRQTVLNRATIIEASGRTPEEVRAEVDRRLRQMPPIS